MNMKSGRPAVTFLIHRDGEVESRSYRVPVWVLRAALVSSATVLALILLGAALYAPIVRAAARVPYLTRRIDRLTAENQQVRQLAGRLVEMENRYAQVRKMLGGDIVPPGPAAGNALPVAYPLVALVPGRQPSQSGASVPQRWPLDERGVVTRGQIGQGSADETHPGIDIAVPTGTPIRAAGGGTVSRTGSDTEYGLFVLIMHPDGYQTMYGHASRLLVADGDEVSAAQVIALSGSTGRSTAPHLHFEVRRGGRSIDPRSLVLEES
ncbi:MAG: M23 family metallopeptidase [Gemmatimonadetes bacterium]|nr:M23 family metallopeptidase [Gemmatimonadota bacterium]